VARILLTTFGSLGDLHPYIALALELNRRGHEAVIGTSGTYAEKVRALGIEFRAIRPDKPDNLAVPEFMKQIMDLNKGPERVIRDYIMPVVRETYADTLAAAEGADLLVSHPLTFTTPLVADVMKLPWASTVLSPMSFFSVYDPPVLPPAPYLNLLRPFGPLVYRFLFGMARLSVRSWSRPVYELRRELGIAPGPDPLFEGQHSPHLALILFSEQLARRQADWPASSVITGFPFYDQDGEVALSPAIDSFMQAGSAPIVFTLGSSAVMTPGAFFEASISAARMLDRRAILLIGKESGTELSHLPEGVAAFDYAPYSALFPRAAAIVHHGGVGTTAQAMLSGRPMLVTPFAFDQPDNADRVQRLGIGRSLPIRKYSAATAASNLKCLLDDPGFERRAGEIAGRMRLEDGAARACDALERLLGTPAGSPARRSEPVHSK
jgi:UDP:flavonoid glycosyltransferase YjiC (YdhE family)